MSYPALCCGRQPNSPAKLGDGCSFSLSAEPMGRDPHKRRITCMATLGGVNGYWTPFAHFDCPCNQEQALVGRVLGEVPKPTAGGLSRLRKVATSFAKILPRVIPQAPDVMPNKYKDPKKRARYLEGLSDYNRRGVDRKSSKLSMFVKFERLNPSKVNPDPRAIQFRSPSYCVALGQYLQPIEHMLYAVKGRGSFPRGRLIGKGLNCPERARELRKKWAMFDSPVCVSLDMSRFDQHVSRELLQIEHSIYLHCHDSPEFRRLLAYQLDNEGKSSRGIKYRMRGRRASGDMNTGLGNSVLMLLMIHAYFAGTHYQTLVDGDDALVIFEKERLQRVVSEMPAHMLQFGMEVKVENVTDSFVGIKWCQSHPIPTEAGWTMVRDPVKVFSNCFTGVKFVDSPKARGRLLATIGHGELALNAGVPILQSLALAMQRSGSGEMLPLHALDTSERYVRCGPSRALSITDEARDAFSAAFGIPRHVQIRIEESLDKLKIELDGLVKLPCHVRPGDWNSQVLHGPQLYQL